MNSNFQESIDFVIKHEGGYVNDPNDSGGETKYGISKRAYPRCDIENLTLSQAKTIYKEDYWNAIKGDELPEKADLIMLDMAVNAGIRRSVKIAQKVVNTKVDGIIGKNTLAAINNFNVKRFIIRFTIARLLHYASCKSFKAHGKGWFTRAIDCLVVLIEKH